MFAQCDRFMQWWALGHKNQLVSALYPYTLLVNMALQVIIFSTQQLLRIVALPCPMSVSLFVYFCQYKPRLVHPDIVLAEAVPLQKKFLNSYHLFEY